MLIGGVCSHASGLYTHSMLQRKPHFLSQAVQGTLTSWTKIKLELDLPRLLRPLLGLLMTANCQPTLAGVLLSYASPGTGAGLVGLLKSCKG